MSRKIAVSGFVIVLVIGVFAAMAMRFGSTSPSDAHKDLREPKLKAGAYQIGTADDLLWLASAVNDGSKTDANAVLTADLDLEGIDWAPIGTYQHLFEGVFDGNGHTIRNLKVEAAEPWQGLFGISTGEIKNIGGLTGEVLGKRPNFGSVVGENRGTVINCTSSVSVQCMSNNDITFGGITGRNKGTISSSVFKGVVTAEHIVAGKKTAGGIAGINEGKIEKCVNAGTIKGHGKDTWIASYFAGIAGISENGNITNSENQGAIEVSKGCENTLTSGITTTAERTGYVSGCIDKGNVLGAKVQ